MYSSRITEILYPLISNSPFPPPTQPLATSILFFASMSLTILDMSDKRNHAVFVPL